MSLNASGFKARTAPVRKRKRGMPMSLATNGARALCDLISRASRGIAGAAVRIGVVFATAQVIMSAPAAAAEPIIDAPAVVALTPAGRTDDGRRWALLRVEMAPGWTTYWRSASEAGAPPRLDWTGSQNVGAIAVAWPAPAAFESYGMRTVGYKGVATFPIALSPPSADAPSTLQLEATLGVCKEICVLMTETLSVVVDDAAPVGAAALRDAALAVVPRRDAAIDQRLRRCEVGERSDGAAFVAADLGHDALHAPTMALVEVGRGVVEARVTSARNGHRIEADWMPSAPLSSDIVLTLVGANADGAWDAIEVHGCRG